MAELTKWDRLREVLASSRFGVLATVHGRMPYTNLVAFAPCDAERALLFATSRATHKYRNLCAWPEVSLFISTDTNRPSDLADAVGVCACGRVRELVEGGDLATGRQAYLERHPELKTFLLSLTTALFAVDVTVYHMVEKFQDVSELRVKR